MRRMEPVVIEVSRVRRGVFLRRDAALARENSGAIQIPPFLESPWQRKPANQNPRLLFPVIRPIHFLLAALMTSTLAPRAWILPRSTNAPRRRVAECAFLGGSLTWAPRRRTRRTLRIARGCAEVSWRLPARAVFILDASIGGRARNLERSGWRGMYFRGGRTLCSWSLRSTTTRTKSRNRIGWRRMSRWCGGWCKNGFWWSR